VAKGTLISTNPNSVLGGEALGNQYYEVVVNAEKRHHSALAFVPFLMCDERQNFLTIAISDS
jgi:hypothetical protein